MNRKVCFLSLVLIMALAAAGTGARSSAGATAGAQSSTGAGAEAEAGAEPGTGARSSAGTTAGARSSTGTTAGARSSAGATAGTAAAAPGQTDPWTPAQLIEPADLAGKLKDIAANPPLIVCVGPSGVIKGSVETGPARDARNLDSLQRLLTKEDRQRVVIIYCGCCPFKNCPNVRPAFSLLLTMGFKQPRLLDLSHNIKVDWIDKGYPVIPR